MGRIFCQFVFFSGERLAMTLAKQAARGVSWTAMATLIRGGLQLLQLAVMARFLTAAELGALALVSIVVGLAQIFTDAGLANALIYFKSLSARRLRQLYLANMLFGLTMTALVALMAQPLASFFNAPTLAPLLLLLSPIFFIRSIGQQPNALLQKDLQFQTLARNEVLAALFAFGLLLIGLWQAMGVFALVISQLCSAFLFTLLLRRAKPCPWPNQLSIGWQDNQPLFRYGLYQAGESLINYLSAQFDQLLLGKMLGTEVLGVYAYLKELVAKPALQLISPIVHRVSFPMMAKHQASHQLSSMYLTIMRCLSLVTVPFYLTIALYPQWILSVVLGSGWLAHADLLRWLALYMLLITLINPVGALLRATGQVKRAFWWNALVTVVRPMVVVVSVHYGLVWLAKGLLLQQSLLLIAHGVVLLKPACQLSLTAYLRTLLLPVFALTFAYSVAHWGTVLLGLSYLWLEIGVLCVVYLLIIAPQLKALYLEIQRG